MPLDVSKLMAFPIPDGRQEIYARDVAFYALSVGMGQDPLDARQLPYVNPAARLKIMPSIALVMAHPGFWLADPATGVDPASVLHAEQSFDLLAPIPAAGIVISRSRITDLIDKGPGKGALFVTETQLYDGMNRNFARLERTTFIRGAGGFGGKNPPKDAIDMPERAPDHVIELATRPEQAFFYSLNGDTNQIHLDPAAATDAGLKRPILQGLCTAGLVCHALLRSLANYDETRLTSVRLRFSDIVFPGETIRVEIWDCGAFRAYAAERNVMVIDRGRCAIRAIFDHAGSYPQELK
ncbi:MaoC/PaaZ C-terminal domain-containing protein [Novosphingobium sp. PP1Y]|uniref:MaoC/PaaZ C-terminal domain-containing protein n=1 Tax=Novosphingobium sp. PP1Y TaxID=702113 RepID=UPI00020EF1D6|nr:MaoC/PaaZ C-terminal domain-containing protein [Novosphingobium sp. PP1Y]CCA93899.1 3-alpha,7-alpha,12-alpha-trihydroxy-5-beta-cholest-24-enoyl-CoA hydratase [Novosphingobium sp. PP1Y]